MPLAFAIANSCGEEGRTRFHRICRISEKYHHDEADKLYGHALTKGTGRNSLGIVFHLAEVARVKMDRNLQTCRTCSLSTPTHVRAYPIMPIRMLPTGLRPMPFSRTQPPPVRRRAQNHPPCPTSLFPRLPLARLPARNHRLRYFPAQRDILLLGAATVLEALNKLVSFVYGRKHKYPCLQVFVTAPSRFRQRCADLGTPFGRTHTQRAAGHLPGENKDLPHGKDQMGHFGGRKR